MQRFHVMPVEVGYNCLQSIYSGCCCCFKRRFIRLPLFYMQIFFRSVRIVQQSNAYVIEAFQCTYRGCPYRNGFSFMCYQLLQRTSIDGYVFRVHFVPFYLFAFDRFECSGSDMQCQLFTAETFGFQICQHFRAP